MVDEGDDKDADRWWWLMMMMIMIDDDYDRWRL